MTAFPRYRLVFVNSYRERFYFVACGEPWPERPGLVPIRETTPDRNRATQFDALPDAVAVLLAARNPPGWSEEAVE
jgi:hypothetical protein